MLESFYGDKFSYKKLTEEVGTERTTERPINIINNKIDNL